MTESRIEKFSGGMSHTKGWGRKVCCEPLPRWNACGRHRSEGGRRRRWACVFMKFQKSHFSSKTPPHSHSMQSGAYRGEAAAHVARLMTALHPHSTPHPPSQLGPAPRFHASFHQPWVQRGRVQEQPAKDMSLGQLKLGGGSRQELQKF